MKRPSSNTASSSEGDQDNSKQNSSEEGEAAIYHPIYTYTHIGNL
jgi:hypothetical protein